MRIPSDLKLHLITVCAVGAFVGQHQKASIPTLEEASESLGRVTCVSQAT